MVLSLSERWAEVFELLWDLERKCGSCWCCSSSSMVAEGWACDAADGPPLPAVFLPLDDFGGVSIVPYPCCTASTPSEASFPAELSRPVPTPPCGAGDVVEMARGESEEADSCTFCMFSAREPPPGLILTVLYRVWRGRLARLEGPRLRKWSRLLTGLGWPSFVTEAMLDERRRAELRWPAGLDSGAAPLTEGVGS